MKFIIIFFIFIINCSGNKVSNYHGSKILDDKFNKIEINQTNKNDLVKLIGPPSTTSDFDKNINVEIYEKSNQIYIIIIDNGSGFGSFSNNLNEILNPYVTTKKNGTGLGLSIVNKIINDHNGKLTFFSIPNGAKVEIIFN